MTISYVAGVRGTGDWVADQRPKSWREAIMFLYPNGTAPLTALLGMSGGEAVNDPEFSWWSETIEAATGTITAIYDGAGEGDAYTYADDAANAAVDSEAIRLKMSAADALKLVNGHVLTLRTPAPLYNEIRCRVIGRDDATHVQVKMLETDPDANHLQACTTFIVSGSSFEEGVGIPTAVSTNPEKFYNYTQIFRTALYITRTAQQTKLRTSPGAYEKLKAQALERHSLEMEMALLFGVRTEKSGSGGKPQRTTMGLIPYLKSAAAGNVLNFNDTTGDWLTTGATGGEDWLFASLEQIFRYGSSDKMVLCGSGALLGINKLAKAGVQLTVAPGQKVYGMDFNSILTPFGTIHLKVHPLMTQITSLRNSMLILEPKNIKYRYIQDTKFYDDKDGNNSGNRIDGKAEEFLTEAGFEFHNAPAMGLLNHVGLDHV